MLHLTAFRIQNFRSITDSGWQTLSPDNITCLIGQNESGKTSVLEALKSFYTGVISEDILRSDLSLPVVCCRFSVPPGWLLKVTDNPGIELKELLAGLTHIELSREWIEDLSSVLMVSGEISKYLDSLECAWQLYLGEVIMKLEGEIKYIESLEAELKDLISKEDEIKSTLNSDEGRTGGFWFFGKKAALEDNPAMQNVRAPSLRNQLNDLKARQKKISGELERKLPVKKAGETWSKIREKNNQVENHFNELSLKLEERHQRMTLLMRPIEDDNPEWKKILEDYRKTKLEKDSRKNEMDRHIALAGYMLDGIPETEADKKVNEIIHSYKSQYNNEILGRKYFEHCPVFEMFEDFGSLLPNRIDMDDIISGNDQVEGYKAARNFLSIAGIDYSFFQQPSSRILKQKIENLNQSLTSNFHDFWQQSVGHNNKINIQFELDHYNGSYGANAGKPFLEFWIKDEGERLYPKQRSRGVRWFLSFYLELKASAGNNKKMVLLVDEPGVSLHARAQEDVLKVFEDIRDRIQVIYTTHSPHLVEINKLHRILAVQRDDIDNLRSTTRILDPVRLTAASPDTLTPLQSIIGNPVSGEGFSSDKINVIVNDTGSFYLINAIIKIMEFREKISIIPSTGISSIPLMCNIFMGWGLEFAVLLFDNEQERRTDEELKNTVFLTDQSGRQVVKKVPGAFFNSEDLLSTLDFKNHILKTREGITMSNSEYIREKEIPRNFVFSRFLTEVNSGAIKSNDLDEETLENFRMITDLLGGLK
ncbi:MAG TPA: AAA family ATPase [Bacteroidales bacterium]|nr:AAA family ATPase [Bacteroidales bacterium]